MMSSSFGGMSGFNRTGGTGARCRIASEISAELSPRKGSVPVVISYSTAPKENKSVRASSSFAPNCSGGMQAPLPPAPRRRRRWGSFRRTPHRPSADAVFQRHPVHEFHGDEVLTRILAVVMNGANRWMIQRGRSLGLAAKTFECLRVAGEFHGMNFQRDKIFEASVLRFIDHAQPG